MATISIDYDAIEGAYLQSDLENLREMHKLPYIRKKTKASMRGIKTEMTTVVIGALVCGFVKFGITPGGGDPDGILL